jgi:uncharacterized protein
MRIGVVADTHIPDRTKELPTEIFEHLRGVDLVLHAGDVSSQVVLDRLATIAPVIAVQGNRDERYLGHLPPSTTVELGRWRIGMIHGTRPRSDQTGDRLRYLRGDHSFQDLRRYVYNSFAGCGVHCIVFGHTHAPCNVTIDGVLVFNPGGVVKAIAGAGSSIGILELSDNAIAGRVINLSHPPRPLTLSDKLHGGAWQANPRSHGEITR